MNQVQVLAGDPRAVHLASLYMVLSQVMKTFTSMIPHLWRIQRGDGGYSPPPPLLAVLENY